MHLPVIYGGIILFYNFSQIKPLSIESPSYPKPKIRAFLFLIYQLNLPARSLKIWIDQPVVIATTHHEKIKGSFVKKLKNNNNQ
jgi:hypothetical protein